MHFGLEQIYTSTVKKTQEPKIGVKAPTTTPISNDLHCFYVTHVIKFPAKDGIIITVKANPKGG